MKYRTKKAVLATVISIAVSMGATYKTVAQTRQGSEAVSKEFSLKLENIQDILRKLLEENRRIHELWQQEFDAKRAALSDAQKLSSAVQLEVKPTVALATSEDGSQEMNLSVDFTYSTKVNDNQSGVQFNVSTRTDDYPAGGYTPTLSNACRLTLDFIKTKVETDLLKYLKPGTRVTIKITGETDGSPIRTRLPYNGEYGDFTNRMLFLNGALDDITVTRQTGITSNAQLAFLRTQGVEDFLSNYIAPLQETKNNFLIYAVENPDKGDEFRRISIEFIIHGALNDVASIAPPPDEDYVSDIDRNIPATNRRNSDCFALIIANEIYASPVHSVPFAMNDGKSFAAYCEKTLGIPRRQIIYIENGTGNQINNGIEQIAGLLKTTDGAGKAIVYYAGHGIPNPETNEAYLIPIDANPTRVSQLVSLNGIYDKLGSVASESVLVVLDACFSGARRNGEMILEGTRSVKIRAKEGRLTGNTVVMSATDGYQTAQPLKDEKHGLFTYHFLKTLQESKGDVTFGELFEKTRRTVAREAILNSAEQTPTVTVSPTIEESWNNIKIN